MVEAMTTSMHPGAGHPGSARPEEPGAGRPRTRLFRHPWRVAIVVGVLVVVANLGVFLLAESDTSREGRTFPNTIDTVIPLPGEITRVRDTVTADLRDDLTGVLVIDGTEVPEDQLERVVPLGQVSFRPGPDRDLSRFAPGDHTITVLYWSQKTDRPARPGSYSWSFRAGV
jgi:hypothetical protein